MASSNQHQASISNALKWIQAVFFVTLILYFGKVLFVPLLFGLLIALITFPICKKMEKWGMPRSLSIACLLTSIILLFIALGWLLGLEINIFLSDFPLISKRLSELSPDLGKWVEETFHISPPAQSEWLHKMSLNLDDDVTGFLKGLLNTTISTLIMLVMIPIYAALFLYHRETFVRVIALIVGDKYRGQLEQILHESVISYFKFIKGNFYVYSIVAALNCIGLFALGIRNALLYGILTSFMMVIPYIGIFVSAAIPVSIALVTKDSIWYPVGVVLIFVFIQYLESNVIFPWVVGNQLNLSTWATLVAIIAATLLWGIAGMVLVSPFLAILKIITDHVPAMKPLNILLNRSEGYHAK
ncbi:AI-2E family transporter [Mucilaginibacter gotjawali]|uniref:AI-2 transport protein TqsA n=2 Tax=Mucilaginibacter gotjawali TaxID=1550579 RepID=A0A110B2N7_9SPHI|nr:AI-2E family transporter [Mucilaginibacter gotjawali]MBB3058789.1 putative PurR-regulated permease PerM [Mucilaginibacter gotjawali]BAU53832.1 AI-2 transport protein TqsA [Mucilaginibacter gotjawali]